MMEGKHRESGRERRRYLEGDALLPLLAENLGVLAVVRHNDQLGRAEGHHLLLKLAPAAALDQVQLLVHLELTSVGKGFQIRARRAV